MINPSELQDKLRAEIPYANISYSGDTITVKGYSNSVEYRIKIWHDVFMLEMSGSPKIKSEKKVIRLIKSLMNG